MHATRGESAGGRGHGAGTNRLFVLLPRLPEVDVHVDPARGHDQALGVAHHLVSCLDRAVDRRHHSVFDQQIETPVEILGRIDQAPSLDQ